jgi:hypothetical protein
MSTLAEDALALRELKLFKEAMARAKSEADEKHALAELRFMERMEAEGTDGVRVEGVLFTPTKTIMGNVQDRQEFVAWAHDNNEELIEYKEKKALVNELVRSKMDNGETLPPGLGFYTKSFVSQRAS